ncbi:MAG TPA: tRNA-modifying protein YgfZ [Candidatus Eisenbacteria bacterium]|jgi:folate-binding protein YgfZ|nr:tRNA-modifying protein YgfZ [Candidatus Eisenbacteria bacterium]
MSLYRLDKDVLAFRPGAAEFIRAYTTNTPDRPLNSFVDLRGRIVAVFDQLSLGPGEVLAAVGRPFVRRLASHLERFLDLCGVSMEKTPLSAYHDLDSRYEPGPGERTIPQKAGRLLLSASQSAEAGAGVGLDEYTLYRVRNGLPMQGVDYDDELLLNVFDEECVSYTKGCYLGQEILARVHSRSGPPRRLRVKSEDECSAPQREAMTSAVTDPGTGKRMGFVFEELR